MRGPFSFLRAPVKEAAADASDVRASTGAVEFGYRRDFEEEYVVNQSACLGEGAFGAVYRCTERNTGEKRAAKLIPKSALKERNDNGSVLDSNDVFAMDAVANEAAVLYRLQQVSSSSQHIINMYGAFETDTHVIFVLELCEGGHLRSLLKMRTFSEAEVLKIMWQLLSAVATLHSHGIMHRDIKLDNIVLVPRPGGDISGCLRLTDFGTAVFFEAHERRPFHGMAGTAQYMAPEVLERGKRYGTEADVFSCGVVMFYLLTGQAPFADELATRKGKLNGDLIKHCSAPAHALLLSLLERVVQARTTAAQALDCEWFARGAAGVSHVPDIGIATRMEQFSQYNKVKHALLMRLAQESSPDELLGLQRQFARLDVDNDGLLSLHEVGEALRKFRTGSQGHRVYADNEINKIVEKLDMDGSGAIDIHEFIAGTLSLYQVSRGGLPTQRMLWQNRLKVLFADLDRDNSGTISEAELLHVFPSRDEVRKAIRAVDSDLDGRLNLAEFLELMKEQESANANPVPRDKEGPVASAKKVLNTAYAMLRGPR